MPAYSEWPRRRQFATMLKHPDLTVRRIERFLTETLRPRLWQPQIPLEAGIYQPGEGPRDYRAMQIAPAQAAEYSYAPIAPGASWGPVWSDAWFQLTGTVPPEWKGKPVAALLDLGAEAIVWDGDAPLQGIDGNHPEFRLFDAAQGGESVTLRVQATGMHPNVSVHGRPQPPAATPFTLRQAALAVYDPALFGLYYDVQMAFLLLRELSAESPRYGQLLYTLNAVVNRYAADDPTSSDACRAMLAATYRKPAVPSAHQVSAVGHAHLDTAWLWPLERTQYKCLHTFSTVLGLMDRYPEFTFACSQPAQYEWVKRMAPKLYARIREKVKSGQWEPIGSMWIEADCNLSSGESLIRQVLLGKNFFLDEFGVETKDLWLPDVFGYAAALPQILKKARVDYFLTQKISWNQTNKFPHQTFLWQGIDGTRIFTHFPPADTPNGVMTPKELAYSVRNFREHDRATRSLYLFGYGDGGGGPTAEMLENARRLQDVEGMPTVTIEKALEFFRKAEADAKDLPVWVGELYLELHRGTYTTQAHTKRGNRKSEFALRDAEFLSVLCPAGLAAYPQAALDRAWKTTLLNQFHDIIPGSSVGEVYRDSERDYAEIARVTAEIIGAATDALAAEIDTRGMRRPVLVVSNLSFYANEAVEVPMREGETPVAAIGPEGESMPVQIVAREGGRSALFVAKNLALHGYAVWDLAATTLPPEPEESVTVSPTHLENESIRVEFDAETGLITRLYDKDSEREVLNDTHTVDAKGNPGERILSACANQLQLFADRPLFW
ncbi:MAG TPA: hypothetical protein VKT32_13100, partial [Chthonomonadaceae bacterium]|nr:hypothetical protein [Chthonomonadaceae bacterium]